MNRFFPVAVIFVAISILLFLFRKTLQSAGIDGDFLLIANGLLFILSLLGFFIQTRHVGAANVHKFIRGVYSSVLMKMLLIIVALFIFILVSEKSVNTGAILISMGIYILYSSIEVFQLMKMVKKK